VNEKFFRGDGEGRRYGHEDGIAVRNFYEQPRVTHTVANNVFTCETHATRISLSHITGGN
jgi:hypothetical protein